MTGTKFAVDAHCHIYPPKISLKAAKRTGAFYDLPATCDGTAETLIARGGECSITHFVVQSVATAPQQVSPINRFIRAVCGEHDCLTGLGALHTRGTIEKDIDEICGLGLHGVKMHPEIQGFRVDDPEMLLICEICSERHLPILLHTGDRRYDCSNLNRLIPVLDRFPDLTVVGAHFGGWSLWKDAASALAGREGFFVDCSSSFYALSNDDVMELIDAYGDENVLFGTDYPMWDPRDEMARFLTLPLGQEAKENILWKNADRVYRVFYTKY